MRWSYVLFLVWALGEGTGEPGVAPSPASPSPPPSGGGGDRTNESCAQLVELVAVPAGAEIAAPTGVTLAGVPWTAAQAATTEGCTNRLSTLAAVAPPGPSAATTGCAMGTSTPSTLQATASAWMTCAC